MAPICYLLFLFFAIQGSFAFRCDETRKCDAYSTIQELSDLGFTPNREQLARLCPRTLQFFQCYFEQVQKCTVLSIPEHAATGHDIASEILRAKNLIVDLCNDDSTLHKDYVANIDCIRDVTSAKSPVCKDDREKLVKDFLESRMLLEYLWIGEIPWEDQLCLEKVYTIACLAEDIHKNCGETARRVYLDVLEHSAIITASDCSGVDDLILKHEFLDYLDLNEAEKNAYLSVFEAFRR